MKPQRKLTTKKKMPRRLLNVPWKSYTRRPRQKRLHVALLTKRTQVCISIGGYMTHALLTLWYPIGPSGIQLPVEFQQVADQDRVCNIFMFNFFDAVPVYCSGRSSFIKCHTPLCKPCSTERYSSMSSCYHAIFGEQFICQCITGKLTFSLCFHM